MRPSRVLIVGVGLDYSVDDVVDAIRRRGGEALRFETDSFPERGKLAVNGRASLATSNGPIAIDSIDAVWLRTRFTGRALPASLDHDVRRRCIESADLALDALVDELPGFHLDPWRTIRDADHKPRQLALARSLGIATPRTLITNDADAVRDFARTCGGNVITKMLVGLPWLSDDSEAPRMYTRALGPSELDALDGLELCPMIFQERIPKAIELRVTVVGRKVFAASVDSQRFERTAVDWRRDTEGLVEAWKAHRLDAADEAKLLSLMDALGLEYGSADYIVDPDGRAVFLEVNAQGDFGFVEHATALPIAEAVADVLLDPAARRLLRSRVR